LQVMNALTSGHAKEAYVKTVGFLFCVCGCICIGVFEGGMGESQFQGNLLLPSCTLNEAAGSSSRSIPFYQCTQQHTTENYTLYICIGIIKPNSCIFISLPCLFPLLCSHSEDCSSLVSFFTSAGCHKLYKPLAFCQLLHTLCHSSCSIYSLCHFLLNPSIFLVVSAVCWYCHVLVTRHRVRLIIGSIEHF
jgi:hypothetical protein